MSYIISVLWQSNIGQITLLSLGYTLFGVLLVGGYLSYFAGGFGVIADLSLQDILFFVPSFVVGFAELIWQEGGKWLKKVFRWISIYMVLPVLTGLLLSVLFYRLVEIEKGAHKQLFAVSFILWVAGLEGVVWSSRRIVKISFWLLMVFAIIMFSFSAPGTENSSREGILISPFLDREIFAWSIIIEFLFLPLLIGREIARALFEQQKLLKVDILTSEVFKDCCKRDAFLVALLRKWAIVYVPSGASKGKLLLLPLDGRTSFALEAQKTKQKNELPPAQSTS